MASRSGGPAMAATALIGAPLTMNAIAGPEPSAMSRLSDAIACCMRASPVNAIDSMSRPLFAKKPLRMPMSSGTNENASGTALPTRSGSAARAPVTSNEPPASNSIAATKERNSAFIGILVSRVSRKCPLEQPLGVAGEDLAPIAVRDVEPLDDVNRRRDRTERRVGCEHHVVGAEEFEPAAHRVDAAAEQRGIAVEVVQVVEMGPLQRRQDLRIVLVAGARAQHLEARPDAAVVKGDHPAEMMGDDLEPRIAVEQAAKHHAHHRHRGVVGPAEAPPHLEPRLRLLGIIRHARRARRVQPDRQIELRHGRENRLENFFVERPARHAGEDLDAAGAELADRAPRLRDRAVHVRHRERGDEGRQALGMARGELGHGVVADAREVEPDLAGGEILDRRIRQRDDLAVIAELVHLAEALVEIEQLFDAAQPRGDVAEPRRDAVHLLEELVGKDVTVDIDDRVAWHRRSPLAQRESSCPRKRASSKHACGNRAWRCITQRPGATGSPAFAGDDGRVVIACSVSQNFVRSGPFNPSIARASFGVATWKPSSSIRRRALPTCSALLLASWPRPMNKLSSRPTRTFPPIITAWVANSIWKRPAPSTDHE